MDLTLQVREGSRFAEREYVVPGGGTAMLTPAIGEDYWILRVPVSENQAVVAFPKFGVVGIGFQQEEDWNTNLPSSCSAEEIYEHIEHNKGDETIPIARCVQAIRMIQEFLSAQK